MYSELTEKFIKTERVFSGSVLKLNVDTIELPNGNQATREWVEHPGAVAVVPLCPNGKIALVRQYRYPINAVTLELPAGKLDVEGESIEECARRELQEETGYIAGNIKHIISINTTPGFTNEVIHIYVAEDLTRGEQSPDEDEFINVELYTPGEISHLIKNGEINDAKSLIGLLMAGVK